MKDSEEREQATTRKKNEERKKVKCRCCAAEYKAPVQFDAVNGKRDTNLTAPWESQRFITMMLRSAPSWVNLKLWSV
jgi:hypothetical protein